MAKATSVVDVILGEAVSGSRDDRFNDMLGIASVIDNRADRGRVTPEQVISNTREFNAYNNSLPKGVESYRDLAEQAWAQVQTYGPVHNGMFYATETAKGNLPKGLEEVARTTGHVYYDDPQNRSFAIQGGQFVAPTAERQAVAEAFNPVVDVDLPGLAVPEAAVSAYAPNITNPAQYAFSDVLAPTPVQTTSINPNAAPSIAPAPPAVPSVPSSGLGMAALAPNGLIGEPQFNMGDNRSAPPGDDILGIVDGAVKSVLGDEWTVDITSGTYNPGQPQYGSDRHDDGKAMDYSVVNPFTGETLSRGVDDDKLNDIAREAAARGVTGMGYGKGYMDRDGTTRFHMDVARPGTWGAAGRAVNVDPVANAAFTAGLGGVGALPNTYTPGGIPEPTSRDEAYANMLADQAATVQGYNELAAGLGAAGIPNVGGSSSTFAAPVGEVERASLPDIAPSVPDAVLSDVPAGYADRITDPGFDYTIATPGTQVASLAPAPVESVERSSLPDIAPAVATPSVPSLADAYGQLASTMGQAGITGLAGNPTPSVPSSTFASLPNELTAPANTFQSVTNPAQNVTTPAPAPTISTPSPAQNVTTPAPNVTTPSVPATPSVAAPSVPSATKTEDKGTSLGSRLGHAAIGGMIGGLPGAIVGGLFGPAITGTAKDVLGGVGKGLGLDGKGLGLGDISLGGLFDSNVQMPESTYSVGNGLDAIDGVFNGSFGVGATATSVGNPNVSFTDIGNGMVAKTNSEFGTTSLVNASSFGWNGGSQKSSTPSSSGNSWGLGDVFGGLGDSIADAFSGWGGESTASTSDEDDSSDSYGYGEFSPT